MDGRELPCEPTATYRFPPYGPNTPIRDFRLATVYPRYGPNYTRR